jgi:hypothetical protein
MPDHSKKSTIITSQHSSLFMRENSFQSGKKKQVWYNISNNRHGGLSIGTNWVSCKGTLVAFYK